MIPSCSGRFCFPGGVKQSMINDMVATYGLKITKGYAPNGICAVSALEYIYEKYGHEILDRTLRLVLGTWEGDRMSLSSGILKGTARMVAIYGDQLDEEMFKDHVGKVSAKIYHGRPRIGGQAHWDMLKR